MEKLKLTTDNSQVLDCRTLEIKKKGRFVYHLNEQPKNCCRVLGGLMGRGLAFRDRGPEFESSAINLVVRSDIKQRTF